MNEPAVIREMLKARTIAVIGLSDDPSKPSNYVSALMQALGHRIVPVNPSLAGKAVLGEKAFASLSELPFKTDLVNVFRLPQYIPAIVDEMMELELGRLWVQQGIVHLEAAAKAEAAGIQVVMDRCIMVERRMAQRGSLL